MPKKVSKKRRAPKDTSVEANRRRAVSQARKNRISYEKGQGSYPVKGGGSVKAPEPQYGKKVVAPLAADVASGALGGGVGTAVKKAGTYAAKKYGPKLLRKGAQMMTKGGQKMHKAATKVTKKAVKKKPIKRKTVPRGQQDPYKTLTKDSVKRLRKGHTDTSQVSRSLSDELVTKRNPGAKMLNESTRIKGNSTIYARQKAIKNLDKGIKTPKQVSHAERARAADQFTNPVMKLKRIKGLTDKPPTGAVKKATSKKLAAKPKQTKFDYGKNKPPSPKKATAERIKYRKTEQKPYAETYKKSYKKAETSYRADVKKATDAQKRRANIIGGGAVATAATATGTAPRPAKRPHDAKPPAKKKKSVGAMGTAIGAGMAAGAASHRSFSKMKKLPKKKLKNPTKERMILKQKELKKKKR
jgi:hypothetical protein